MTNYTLFPSKSKSKITPPLSSSDYVRGKQVQQSWCEFLPTLSAWDGALFITFTFNQDVTEGLAWGHVERFYQKAMRLYTGTSNWRRKGLGTLLVAAMEFQKSGRRHFHLMFDKIGNRCRYEELGKLWRSCSYLAGNNDIQAIRDTKKVSGYISKYITKGGDIRVLGVRDGLKVL